MPDFLARFTAGSTLERWSDPPLESRPSRINPIAARPLMFRLGEPGEQIEITASVDGVSGPLDAALGGRTFFGWLAEYPGLRPAVTGSPGQSSVRRFTPGLAGHYTYVLRRKGGGGIILHVDVQGT